MMLLVLIGTGIVASSRAEAATYTLYHPSASCPSVGDITDQSLLVVLLDRSGSLIYEPGATDPNGYSTSITKALADLWPGSMAVVPFSDVKTPVLGPVSLADKGQRDQLKNQVQSYPIGGATPLAPALHKALDLVKNAPSGSRVVIVTDGQPTPDILNGVNQVDDITHNLIPQFCASGKTVSAFGLTLDTSTSDGKNADALLRTIATGTNGIYQNVRNSQDLAKVVIQLYADWQHLIFFQATAASDSYSVPIDTYAKKVAFVTFRANNNHTLTLEAPNGQPMPDQVLDRSTDRHYEIDNLVLSDVNQPGTYTVMANGDTQAQVYALVESRLHARLIKPTTQTTAYIGQPLQIEAQLFNDATPVIPQPDEATINAHITIQANGQTTSQDVELVQTPNSASFTRAITLPAPAGTVTIQIQAVYKQVPVEASAATVTIPLKAALVQKTKPKPVVVPSCGSSVSCYIQRYPIFFALGLLLLLALLLLPWFLAKGPRGLLRQSGNEQDLAYLNRPLGRKLFNKSTLSSKELEDYGNFNFNGAKFDLVFGGGCTVKNRDTSTPIKVKSGNQYEEVTRESGSVALADKDVLYVGTAAPATFLDQAEDDART
jgi:hypothetical protein